MIIQDYIVSRVSGDQNSSSQYLYQNTIIEPTFNGTQFFEYNIPTFNPSGASFDYYGQNVDTISTNFNNEKIIVFNWTGGEDALSGTNIWRQEIYQIPYSGYTDFVNSTGTTQQALATQIQQALSNPFVTLDLVASAVTNVGLYDYSLPALVKPTNQYTQQFFNDKYQYFIDSKLIFNRQVDNTLGGFIYETPFDGTSTVPPVTATTGQQQYVYYNTDGLITGITPSILGQFQTIISEGHQKKIVSGVTSLVSGMTVNGAYFVYFTNPNKPNINVINNAPSVFGILDTFSPIFDFNNVSDGDYYNLYVNYDTNDISFTGNQKALFTIPQQPGDPNFIRSHAQSLNAASNFIYKIGNTRELINIFGVKQHVTTWSVISSAYTANDGKFNVSGNVFQTYLQYGPPISSATVSFYVLTNSSSVDLGADVPTDNSILGDVTQSLGGGVGSTFSALTDVNGYYEIPDVPGGYSQVTITSPLSISGNPIFSSSTAIVNINQDLGKDFNLSIYWGFSSLTFNEFENYQFV